jgi:hypothetical protein
LSLSLIFSDNRYPGLGTTLQVSANGATAH